MKPGTIRKVNGRLVRIARRDGSCEGCVFDNLFCPAIKVQRSNKEVNVDCFIEGVKFIEP